MTGEGPAQTTRYVIAVRRERRAEVAADWVEALRDAPGVELAGAGATARDVRRVTVRVTETGLRELRARVGAFCHIEPVIAHTPQREPDADDP